MPKRVKSCSEKGTEMLIDGRIDSEDARLFYEMCKSSVHSLAREFRQYCHFKESTKKYKSSLPPEIVKIKYFLWKLIQESRRNCK